MYIQPTSDVMNLDEQTEKSLSQIDTPSYVGNPLSEAESVSAQFVPSDPNTRKQFIQEVHITPTSLIGDQDANATQKATLLRDRLQNAMRHVRDPQFDRRVSELEAHSRKYPRLSGSGIQQHLEQKYGAGKEEDDEDDQMLSTPRAQISRLNHLQEADGVGDGEVTPTQNTFRQDQHVASPSQMLLSSPTYNPNSATTAQRGSRPGCQSPQKTAEDTSHSSQRGGNEGDGDAVDGLLKLMGTTPNSGAESSGYEKRDC
jgi:hypothetical protein